VVYLNVGLHDLRTGDFGTPEVALDEYEANLSAIIGKLRDAEAQIIYATTTPVPPGAKRRIAGAEIAYNAAARRVMHQFGVPVDDLWAVATEHPEWQNPSDVHFTVAGSAGLASHAAATIRDRLSRNYAQGSLAKVP
jgi:acyl-CoA thioesterase-1